MARFSIILALLVVNFAAATYIPRAPAGTQFITGACSSDADCASECCGFNSGKCAGPIIAQERDGGCGHGDAQPNDNAARKLRGEAPAQTDSSASSGSNNGSTGAAGNNTSTTGTGAANNGTTSTGSGKPPGTQFITGPCASDSECASACCGFNSGKCAGPVVAQERDGGCGFGNPTPNDDAARKIRGQTPAGAGNASTASTGSTGGTTSTSTSTGTNNGTTDTNGNSTSTDTGAATNGTSTATGSTTSGSTSTGSGKPLGTQFITGACASDAECASSCCGFKSGKCAGPIIAQERDGGCGFGDAQPNDTAAKKLRGQ